MDTSNNEAPLPIMMEPSGARALQRQYMSPDFQDGWEEMHRTGLWGRKDRAGQVVKERHASHLGQLRF